MTSLHELQTRILDALLSASADAPAALPAAALPAATPPVLALIDAPPAAALARLAVYRNTVRSNVAAALRSTYPAVLRLVGDAYFQKLAHDFIVRHPSTSGDLTPVGALFPNYLALLHHHDEFAYLGDVARLELLIQETLLAAEAAPFDLERLARVPPARYDALRFVLHPALRLFESRYPVKRIWESNAGGNAGGNSDGNSGSDAEPECIDLAAGGDRLAVLQHRLQLQFHAVTPGEWCWLGALGRGEPFATSVELAAASDGEFDAAVALRRFVSLGAVADFQ